jgi:hypothetical protein
MLKTARRIALRPHRWKAVETGDQQAAAKKTYRPSVSSKRSSSGSLIGWSGEVQPYGFDGASVLKVKTEAAPERTEEAGFHFSPDLFPQDDSGNRTSLQFPSGRDTPCGDVRRRREQSS